jgi:hypothetical protein
VTLDPVSIAKFRGRSFALGPSERITKTMVSRREILSERLKLPARERARLATELVQSLDESEDPDASPIV